MSTSYEKAGGAGVQRLANPHSERPTHEDGVSAHPLDNELVVYDARSAEAFVLNPTAARIWELCDGKHSIEAIAREIASDYALEYGRVLGDVHELVIELRHAGLLVA